MLKFADHTIDNVTALIPTQQDRTKGGVLFMLSLSVLVLFSSTGAPAQDSTADPHDLFVADNKFPSAAVCKTCHPVHYKEWSVSAHAYAQMSPVFNAMQATIIKRTNGTNGDFCIRCHTPIGMNMSEPAFSSNLDRHAVAREGVTCITCHRRDKAYGKVSGRLAMVEGDVFEPVYGPHGNEELKRVIQSGAYDVNGTRGNAGRSIHADAKELPEISTPAFCGSCHDVNHVDSFRLEEAFSEYKSSPAAARGVSCQDCHMGKTPGVPSGYFEEPIAIVGGKPTRPRKRTNHMFVGPDYSIVHRGIFPHNPAAQSLATVQEWLQFDDNAGWGTDEFEDTVAVGYVFPRRWASVVDRYEARSIIAENQELLEKIAAQRKMLLQSGYQPGDVVVDKAGRDGIQFSVEIKNGTDGHNVPTGFDAERLVYLNITVEDNTGKVVFESGDLDPNGDLRDMRSEYVRNGELPEDAYLFNLQSIFLVRMLRGGEREQVLPINASISPLPFIRPSTQSNLLVGRPLNARKQRATVPPLSSRWATYEVGAEQLTGSDGPYKARIRIIAGMVPVNLIHEIQDVGFDYGMSPHGVANAIVDGHILVHESEVVLRPGRMELNPVEPVEGTVTAK